MTTAKKDWRTYTPVLLWTILTIILSTGGSIQLPPTQWDFIGIDKIGHLSFYAIHAILLLWAFTKTDVLKEGKERTLVAILLGVSLGIILEIVQFSFYPNRYFEILDIIANISGSLLGMTLFKKFIE